MSAVSRSNEEIGMKKTFRNASIVAMLLAGLATSYSAGQGCALGCKEVSTSLSAAGTCYQYTPNTTAFTSIYADGADALNKRGLWTSMGTTRKICDPGCTGCKGAGFSQEATGGISGCGGNTALDEYYCKSTSS